MFGIKAKAEKVNLKEVVTVMQRRYWEAEAVAGKPDTILVHGKYYNNRRMFRKLYLQFVGENVRFKDPRGNVISEVSKSKMYPEMMDILNVLP